MLVSFVFLNQMMEIGGVGRTVCTEWLVNYTVELSLRECQAVAAAVSAHDLDSLIDRRRATLSHKLGQEAMAREEI